MPNSDIVLMHSYTQVNIEISAPVIMYKHTSTSRDSSIHTHTICIDSMPMSWFWHTTVGEVLMWLRLRVEGCLRWGVENDRCRQCVWAGRYIGVEGGTFSLILARRCCLLMPTQPGDDRGQAACVCDGMTIAWRSSSYPPPGLFHPLLQPSR